MTKQKRELLRLKKKSKIALEKPKLPRIITILKVITTKIHF